MLESSCLGLPGPWDQRCAPQCLPLLFPVSPLLTQVPHPCPLTASLPTGFIFQPPKQVPQLGTCLPTPSSSVSFLRLSPAGMHIVFPSCYLKPNCPRSRLWVELVQVTLLLRLFSDLQPSRRQHETLGNVILDSCVCICTPRSLSPVRDLRGSCEPQMLLCSGCTWGSRFPAVPWCWPVPERPAFPPCQEPLSVATAG